MQGQGDSPCIRLWHSWAKEEHISWIKRGHSRSALILFLIVILVGIEAVRRIQLAKGRSVTNQTIALEKLEAEFQDAQRIASDWGWWDDSFAFIEGKNPSFPSQNLATSTLFDQGPPWRSTTPKPNAGPFRWA